MLELTDLSLAEAAGLIQSRELTSSELTRAYLQRIDRLNPKINAYITVTPDRAMDDAQAADAEIASGSYRGPLHGIPIALKDIIDTAGILTTSGSKIRSEYVPDRDAGVAQKFAEAGAVLLGKLSTHEFALGATNDNPHFGAAHNPWDLSRVTGGSSGGSGAATTARLAAGTIGTDTGGSIRLPASLCGCVGMKGTFGRVSKAGVFPISQVYDHVGPMTRTVEDNALILAAIAGYDPLDPYSARVPVDDYLTGLKDGIAGLRVGVPGGMFATEPVAEVKAAFATAVALFTSLGATVVPSGPDLTTDFVMSTMMPSLVAEAQWAHRDHLPGRTADFGKDVQALFLDQPMPSTAEYLGTLDQAEEIRRRFRIALEEVDVLLTPTTPISAIPIGAQTVTIDGRELPMTALAWLTMPMNLAGVPTLSMPCGFTSIGLPIGLSITAKPFDEATIYRAAYAYEQAAGWYQRQPPEPA